MHNLRIRTDFLVFFIVLLVVFNVASARLPDVFFYQALNLTCRSVSAFSNALGIASSFEEGFVTVSGFKLNINIECTALQFLIIYAAGVLAYPGHGFAYKLQGVMSGGCFLFLMNILRITLLGLIGACFERRIFDIVHIYIWQGVFILIVLLAWFVWTRGEAALRPVFRRGGMFVVAAAVSVAVLLTLMGSYLKALSLVSEALLDVATGTAVSVSSLGDKIMFVYSGVVYYFPVSVDVLDSIIFFSLMVASAERKNMKGTFKGLLAGTLGLSLIHLVFVTVAGLLVVHEAGTFFVREIMWVMRGVSLSGSLVLYLILRAGFKNSSTIKEVSDEKVVFQT